MNVKVLNYFQKLKIEFKKEQFLNEIIFVDPWLVSYKEVFDEIIIDKLVD